MRDPNTTQLTIYLAPEERAAVEAARLVSLRSRNAEVRHAIRRALLENHPVDDKSPGQMTGALD